MTRIVTAAACIPVISVSIQTTIVVVDIVSDIALILVIWKMSVKHSNEARRRACMQIWVLLAILTAFQLTGIAQIVVKDVLIMSVVHSVSQTLFIQGLMLLMHHGCLARDTLQQDEKMFRPEREVYGSPVYVESRPGSIGSDNALDLHSDKISGSRQTSWVESGADGRSESSRKVYGDEKTCSHQSPREQDITELSFEDNSSELQNRHLPGLQRHPQAVSVLARRAQQGADVVQVSALVIRGAQEAGLVQTGDVPPLAKGAHLVTPPIATAADPGPTTDLTVTRLRKATLPGETLLLFDLAEGMITPILPVVPWTRSRHSSCYSAPRDYPGGYLEYEEGDEGARASVSIYGSERDLVSDYVTSYGEFSTESDDEKRIPRRPSNLPITPGITMQWNSVDFAGGGHSKVPKEATSVWF